jgi:hypothetical protein
VWIISKQDKKAVAEINAAIQELLSDNKATLPADKICLKDGDLAVNDYNRGHYTLIMSSSSVIGERSLLTTTGRVLFDAFSV